MGRSTPVSCFKSSYNGPQFRWSVLLSCFSLFQHIRGGEQILCCDHVHRQTQRPTEDWGKVNYGERGRPWRDITSGCVLCLWMFWIMMTTYLRCVFWLFVRVFMWLCLCLPLWRSMCVCVQCARNAVGPFVCVCVLWYSGIDKCMLICDCFISPRSLWWIQYSATIIGVM